MSAVIEAKRAMAELGTKAQEVLKDSTLTNAEKKTRLDAYQADLKSHSDTIALHEQASRLIGGGEAPAETKSGPEANEHRSFGRQAVESDGYKSMLNGQSKGVQIELKAANTIDEGIIPAYSGGSGMAGALSTPEFRPGIVPILFQRMTVADLLAQSSTNNTSISYVIEAAFNDNTGTVAEKGLKPQLDVTLARRQDNVVKIANIAKITDETFQDAPQFQSYLQNRMVFGIQRKEEQQLLSGSGTSPDLQGLLNRSGLAPDVTTAAGLTAVKIMEGVFNQITALRSQSFVEPDALVIHPSDWQTIRLGKDSQGQYYAGGPFTGAYGNGSYTNVESIWGLKAVITTAIPQGTVLVGGYQQCGEVIRRQGITLEMTNSNEDDFTHNLVTLRAEERLALAVTRPAGFGKVVLTA